MTDDNEKREKREMMEQKFTFMIGTSIRHLLEKIVVGSSVLPGTIFLEKSGYSLMSGRGSVALVSSSASMYPSDLVLFFRLAGFFA